MKKSKKNIEDQIISLITESKLKNDFDDLKTEFEKDPQKQRLYNEYLDIWQASLKARSKDDYDEHKAWLNLKNQVRISINKYDRGLILRNFSRVQQIAAAAIIFFISSFVGITIYKSYLRSYNPSPNTEYYVPYGSRSQVKLPDGSYVWLNAGSKLRHNRQFSQKNRNIYLEGEAYFDVSKNKNMPFVVNTSGITIKVLGTAFNVKAYPDEKIIETTVARGEIQIFDNIDKTSNKNTIVLRANQKASFIKRSMYEKEINPTNIKDKQVKQSELKIFTNNQYIKIDKNVIPEIYTSWKDKRWIIEREELQSLAIKMGRRYNVNISFQDESLKNYIFSGVLEDETLEQVLEAIKLTAPINYYINQNQVVLSKNKFYKPN